jgi:hypothetical protein
MIAPSNEITKKRGDRQHL